SGGGAGGEGGVRARGVRSQGRGGWIEQAWLREEDERAIRMGAVPHGVFRSGDFVRGAAEVNCSGAQAFGSLPWNRASQGVIDLENPGAISEFHQLSLVLS